MRLSDIVAVLGLDETDAVRAMPLTDEAIAQSRRSIPVAPEPTPRRERPKRQIIHAR